jgi:hypothetical protein
MMRMRVVAVLGCALALGGCAIGRKHAYHNSSPRMMRGTLSVALVVQDHRQAVLSGAKAPNFVGFQRGGFGNPFDVTTASGRSLADDFTTSIRHGLLRAGYQVTALHVSDRPSPAEVQQAMAQAGAERGLVFLIQEWKADTHTNTALHYGVDLLVLDPSGQVLARAAIGGNDNLGGSFMDPAGFAEEAVPRAYNQKLEELLSNPSVVRALKPAPAPAAPPAPPPDAPSVAPLPSS